MEDIGTAGGARSTDKQVIIVSGSSGLIGTALINRLSEQYRVVGLDNVGFPFPPITAECVCIDLTSDNSIKNAIRRVEYGYGKQIASVVHLAAYYDFAGKPSPFYEEITVKGTEKLLKALRRFQVD
jgi:nucleoside-diphosphate-sugar epimerase